MTAAIVLIPETPNHTTPPQAYAFHVEKISLPTTVFVCMWVFFEGQQLIRLPMTAERAYELGRTLELMALDAGHIP